MRIVTIKKLNEERDRETKQRLDFLKEKEAKDKAGGRVCHRDRFRELC